MGQRAFRWYPGLASSLDDFLAQRFWTSLGNSLRGHFCFRYGNVRLSKFLFVMLLGLLFAACGGSTEVSSEDSPAALAEVDAPDWLSFSIGGTGPEFDELSGLQGVINADGEQLVLAANEFPHHTLALYSDGVAWEISEGEFGRAWVEANEFTTVGHDGFETVFRPLFENGVFSGSIDLDLDGEVVSADYDFTNSDSGEVVSGTVTGNGVVIDVVFDAPADGFTLPDPGDLVLMPDDLTGDNANPVTIAWLEARASQETAG